MTASADPRLGPDERDRQAPVVDEPHLPDLGDVSQVVAWIAGACATGMAWDVTKEVVRKVISGIANRHGASRVREVRDKVRQSAPPEAQDRVDEVFDDYRIL